MPTKKDQGLSKLRRMLSFILFQLIHIAYQQVDENSINNLDGRKTKLNNETLFG